VSRRRSIEFGWTARAFVTRKRQNRSYHTVILTYWDAGKIKTRIVSDRRFPPRHPAWTPVAQDVAIEVAAGGGTLIHIHKMGFFVPPVVANVIKHRAEIPGLAADVPLRTMIKQMITD
jgi:hypothetical protein